MPPLSGPWALLGCSGEVANTEGAQQISLKPDALAGLPCTLGRGDSARSAHYSAVHLGMQATLSHRILFLDEKCQELSPWLDISLHPADLPGALQVLCVCPSNTAIPYELANEPFNPLRVRGTRNHYPQQSSEAVNCSVPPLSASSEASMLSRPNSCARTLSKPLSVQSFGIPSPWNLAIVPQTTGHQLVDPHSAPLEVVDVSERVRRVGEVYSVEPLGMIIFPLDGDRVSTKILAVALDERGHEAERQIPSKLLHVADWMRRRHLSATSSPVRWKAEHVETAPTAIATAIAAAHTAWKAYAAKHPNPKPCVPFATCTLDIAAALLERRWARYLDRTSNCYPALSSLLLMSEFGPPAHPPWTSYTVLYQRKDLKSIGLAPLEGGLRKPTAQPPPSALCASTVSARGSPLAACDMRLARQRRDASPVKASAKCGLEAVVAQSSKKSTPRAFGSHSLSCVRRKKGHSSLASHDSGTRTSLVRGACAEGADSSSDSCDSSSNEVRKRSISVYVESEGREGQRLERSISLDSKSDPESPFDNKGRSDLLVDENYNNGNCSPENWRPTFARLSSTTSRFSFSSLTSPSSIWPAPSSAEFSAQSSFSSDFSPDSASMNSKPLQKTVSADGKLQLALSNSYVDLRQEMQQVKMRTSLLGQRQSPMPLVTSVKLDGRGEVFAESLRLLEIPVLPHRGSSRKQHLYPFLRRLSGPRATAAISMPPLPLEH
eukprot:TRINITY_DN9657_c0_g1_i1.p1 TRINITY_DN9657_c0_g1~~TRINITY_DN9657_c0_g1_i1.p1  ORF type:complete len:721 (-),score=59.13 TRINITY_DN9657_c0_g1_i1:433-2595(-)